MIHAPTSYGTNLRYCAGKCYPIAHTRLISELRSEIGSTVHQGMGLPKMPSQQFKQISFNPKNQSFKTH